jgi:hypothetical protein
MTDEQLASVTVVGRIAERPTMSETATGKTLAHFWLQCGDNQVWCMAVGPLAENVRRFGAVGAEVLGWGRLNWLHGQPEQPHVQLDRLAFVNPKEVASILGWDLQ